MPDETGALKEIEKFFSFFELQAVAEGIAAHGEVGDKELSECKKLGQRLGKASKK